jgi:hypothetical protein
MSWFDFNSLQEQLAQASEIMNTVNRLDILNLDEMAVEQEEEEKMLDLIVEQEEAAENREEDEED